MALSPTYVPAATIPDLQDGDRCTEDEYFAFTDVSEERWEFIAEQSILGEPLPTGVIRAMAGGTEEHAVIAGNLVTALNVELRVHGNQTCRVTGSDRKVRTATGRNTFPDVSIVCGVPNYYRNKRDTVTNPILVAEVLSPSTESYDRGEKPASYQSIPSLEQILLIDTETALVEIFTRTPDEWETIIVRGLDAKISVSSLSIEITMADVYALIDVE